MLFVCGRACWWASLRIEESLNWQPAGRAVGWADKQSNSDSQSTSNCSHQNIARLDSPGRTVLCRCTVQTVTVKAKSKIRKPLSAYLRRCLAIFIRSTLSWFFCSLTFAAFAGRAPAQRCIAVQNNDGGVEVRVKADRFLDTGTWNKTLYNTINIYNINIINCQCIMYVCIIYIDICWQGYCI